MTAFGDLVMTLLPFGTLFAGWWLRGLSDRARDRLRRERASVGRPARFHIQVLSPEDGARHGGGL